MERAGQLRLSGESLIGCGQYAVDCVQPKCAELERICTEFTARFNYRRSRLHQAHLIWRAILHVSNYSLSSAIHGAGQISLERICLSVCLSEIPTTLDSDRSSSPIFLKFEM